MLGIVPQVGVEPTLAALSTRCLYQLGYCDIVSQSGRA